MDALISGLADLNLVLIGAVLVSWVATGMALQALKSSRAQQLQLQATLVNLEQTLSANSHGLVGMGKKLLTLEKAMKPGQGRAAPTATPSNVIPLAEKQDRRYQQARVLLGQGLPVEQVASAAGISMAEVQLLAMLRKPGKVVG